MADILIRGMEMPDGCHHCRFSYLDKGETNGGEPCSVIMCSAMAQGTNGAEYDGSRPSWCPLVPLPEGHGRLGDLDALINELHNLLDKREKGAAFSGDREAGVTWDDAINKIIAAPIIIPAEGGADDGT